MGRVDWAVLTSRPIEMIRYPYIRGKPQTRSNTIIDLITRRIGRRKYPLHIPCEHIPCILFGLCVIMNRKWNKNPFSLTFIELLLVDRLTTNLNNTSTTDLYNSGSQSTEIAGSIYLSISHLHITDILACIKNDYI